MPPWGLDQTAHSPSFDYVARGLMNVLTLLSIMSRRATSDNCWQRKLFCLSARLTVTTSVSLCICNFRQYVCSTMARVELRNCSPIYLFIWNFCPIYLFTPLLLLIWTLYILVCSFLESTAPYPSSPVRTVIKHAKFVQKGGNTAHIVIYM